MMMNRHSCPLVRLVVEPPLRWSPVEPSVMVISEPPPKSYRMPSMMASKALTVTFEALAP